MASAKRTLKAVAKTNTKAKAKIKTGAKEAKLNPKTHYQPWVDAFGHTSEDPAVLALLAAAGVKDKDKPKIGRSEIDDRVDIGRSMTIVFTDRQFFAPPRTIVGAGKCVLSGVIVHLEKLEGDKAPFDLTAKATAAELKRRFGKAVEEEPADDDFGGWEMWKVEGGHVLTATYASSDRKSIDAILLGVPLT